MRFCHLLTKNGDVLLRLELLKEDGKDDKELSISHVDSEVLYGTLSSLFFCC